MSSEKIPNSIVGDDENFVKRMGVEMAIAKHELGEDFETLTGEWVLANSEPIKIIFNRRALKETDFLNRCTLETEKVAKEISDELNGSN